MTVELPEHPPTITPRLARLLLQIVLDDQDPADEETSSDLVRPRPDDLGAEGAAA